MLVLTRKKNESVILYDNITVIIVEVRGDKVRLGITAPFWFGFVGSAVLVVLLWRQFAHIAHA